MTTDDLPRRRFDIRLEPGGERFAALAGQDLLSAALAAGLPLARSCRAGTCRACMSRLLSGQVHCRIDWPGLTPEERRDGFILSCVCEARSDLVLAPAPYGR